MKNDFTIDAKHLLALGQDPLWRQVYRSLGIELRQEFDRWVVKENRPDGVQQGQWLSQEMCFFLVYFCDHLLGTIGELEAEFQRYWGRIQRAATRRDKEHHLLACAAFLGQTRSGLRRDRAAMSRFFDEYALKDRYTRLLAEKERLLAFALERLNANTGHFLGNYRQSTTTNALSARVERENLIENLIAYRGDYRVVLETLRWIETFILSASGSQEQWLGPQLVHFCYRLLSDPAQPVWLRTQGLNIALLLDTDAALEVLRQRFEKAEPGDSLFFRGRAVAHLVALGDHPAVESILWLAASDPSEHVRQCLIRSLPKIPDTACGHLVEMLDRNEIRPGARALLIRIICEMPLAKGNKLGAHKVLLKHLAPEQTDLVLRETLRALPAWYVKARGEGADVADELSALTGALDRLTQHHPKTKVRRWVAQSREHLWAASQAGLIPAVSEEIMDTTNWQKKGRIHLDSDCTDEDLGRFLATRTESQFGFDIQRKSRRIKFTKGHGYRFRLWRFVHELRTSATDKRQNYNHTRGRIYYGLLQVPGWNLSELSQTKVPGEPLHIPEEGNWRPYLPLLDHVLSSLDQGWPTRPLSLFTTEGITRIYPPKGLFRRLWAKLNISLRFAALSETRNWREHSGLPPEAYLGALQRFGFRFEIEGYLADNGNAGERQQVDQRVRRFFPGMAAIPLPAIWTDFKSYFYSVYENSLHQLLLFLGGLAALFFGRHLITSGLMRQARLKLPLVIGGWGTRGKSGTERLKAALLNALGLSVLSKTTGCEAMFLFNPANRPLREMFLFRPYDKASIWEQVDLVRLSAKFNVDVFLWECMGLTPRYVQILQEQWMRDDLSTITNCYPDHEDIQGPAGIDIPQVMQRFIPKKGKLITTEHNMYPFLSEGARDKGTTIIKVDESAGDLLPADVLDRFPYEEHPTNIALVMRMAEEMGIPTDFAVKEMADRVVADLGVLKVYPIAPVRGRKIRFINGMSANERHAALANWERLGLTQLTLTEHPDQWIATVINNRADRIPRSQVFAKMLATEVRADQHFLIGSNLDGLNSYIEESWGHRLDLMGLASMTPDEMGDALRVLCDQLRVPADELVIRARLNAMLNGVGAQDHRVPDDAPLPAILELRDRLNPDGDHKTTDQSASLLAQYTRDYQELQEVTELSEKLRNGPEAGAKRLRDQTTLWFKKRIEVIWDFYASGDDVVEAIVQRTPPGLLSHTIGMQNIKGTGLDFVYRWQSWDQHHALLQQLLHGDTSVALAAARGLASSEEFGVLDFQYVTEALSQALDQPNTQSEPIQAELALIRSKVEQRKSQRSEVADTANRESSFTTKLVNGLELLFDPGAAVRRRKHANRIYADLVAQRISHERAALELKKLNKEQKGGWLKERLNL
ncbi:hypothetical protein [Marinobacter caseinilyticus]|uniref:hypothetical protein n=1 Tax=Marinobacter caseinilyticus TaxID=2692195 RepID=UPI001409F4CE|nr:hypothetical protein [Marinobacter caseinilyticus]